jgi:hypothetical protein
MTAMRGRIVSVVVAGLLLGGCSADEPAAAPRDPPAGTRASAPTPSPQASPSPVPDPDTTPLDCANAIDGGPPPAGFEVVLGIVALPTSSAGPALQAFGSGDPSTPALFAKTGLLIRADSAFDLVVPVLPGNRLTIGWGNRAFRPGKRVVVPGCADQYGTGWLAYPGGYWVDRPLCLPLTVRAGNREQVVRIGVGTPCPGQQPPA